MKLSYAESIALAQAVIPEKISADNEVVLCPSFTALHQIGEIIKNSDFKLGAQNVFYHEKGSYTGEITPLHLKELGVKYVIVGHSERRQNLHETNEEINRKTKICLENNVTPIVCVGETLEQRQRNQTDLTLITQISSAMQDIKLKEEQQLFIAYEPVWVIGSGQAINPSNAEHAAQVISHTLLDFFPPNDIKNKVSILYGGSIDADNVNDFIKPGLLNGVLVGGSSQNAEKFIPLIKRLSS